MNETTKKIILAHISDVQTKLDSITDEINSITKNNEIIKTILNKNEELSANCIEKLFK